MASEFINEYFLLQNDTAKHLYHEHAAKMPIFDYHCHLPVKQVAEDVQFKNLTQVWLYGDHYKWRAMRTNGVDERYCTGANFSILPSQSIVSLDAYGIKKAFRNR